jgi:hypothetical protein
MAKAKKKKVAAKAKAKAAPKAATKKKTTVRKVKRLAWTRADVAELRKYAKEKLPVARISKLMKRSAGALRQKAYSLNIRIGHRR